LVFINGKIIINQNPNQSKQNKTKQNKTKQIIIKDYYINISFLYKYF